MIDYYDWFSDNGFSLVGCGFSHNVFLKNGLIYKVAKDEMSSSNCENCYSIEMDTLNLILHHGFPSIETIRLFKPGDLHPTLWVLCEAKARGVSFSCHDIPAEAEMAIFEFLLKESIRIKSNSFKNNAIEWYTNEKSWKVFLIKQYRIAKEVLDKKEIDTIVENVMSILVDYYCNYCGEPRLLLMDANVSNFFFDANNIICNIIDMDHPIYGDPFYQEVSIVWKHGNKYKKYLNIDNNDYATLVIYYYLIASNDIAYRISNNCVTNEVLNNYYSAFDCIKHFANRQEITYNNKKS